MAITVSTAAQEALQKVYIAYFGRPADEAGLNFYGAAYDVATDDMGRTAVINDAAGTFGASTEAATISGLDPSAFIPSMYLQAFGRAYDSATDGTFWIDAISSGAETQASAMMAILNGSPSGGADATAVANKITVAQAYTNAVVSGGKSYSGSTAAAAAKAVLDVITTDSATVTTATAAATMAVAALSVESNIPVTTTDTSSEETTISDDYPYNLPSAPVLTLGSSINGTIETVYDLDSFLVNLTAGKTYTIQLEGVDIGSGLLLDPYLGSIYDSSTTSISNTQDDDSGAGLNSKLSFTPDTTASYYITASSAIFDGTGSYRLSIDTGKVIPTIPSSFTIKEYGFWHSAVGNTVIETSIANIYKSKTDDVVIITGFGSSTLTVRSDDNNEFNFNKTYSSLPDPNFGLRGDYYAWGKDGQGLVYASYIYSLADDTPAFTLSGSSVGIPNYIDTSFLLNKYYSIPNSNNSVYFTGLTDKVAFGELDNTITFYEVNDEASILYDPIYGSKGNYYSISSDGDIIYANML